MNLSSTPTVIKRIALIVLLAIMAPILFLVIYRINDLNENEKILEKIYLRQMEAIIFSINQFSNDLLNSFANAANEIIASPTEKAYPDLLKMYNNTVLWIAWEDTDGIHSENIDSTALSMQSLSIAKNTFQNDTLISRLQRYQSAGYTKLEPLGTVPGTDDALNALLFINKSGHPSIIVFDPNVFVKELLAPKLQEIARQDIAITIKNAKTNDIAYTTDTSKTELIKSKELWLLPQYQVGLSTQGSSLQSIVKQRSRDNLIILIIIITMMTIGLWMIIRNLIKEMQLAQTKSDFVANVSHEIRTPLSLISMFAETLLMDRVREESKKKEYYNIIFRETSRLRNIVNKILNFSQIEARKKQYSFDLIMINQLVKDVADTYSFHLKNKGFAFELACGADDLQIEADEEAVVESIINLIDNAIKYSEEVKFLRIETFRAENMIGIAVSDKGRGIPARLHQHIFDKFYRVTSKNVYHTMGTGLGLTLVKNIMEAHNGKVQLTSTAGEGSTFTLLFPIKQHTNGKNTNR